MITQEIGFEEYIERLEEALEAVKRKKVLNIPISKANEKIRELNWKIDALNKEIVEYNSRKPKGKTFEAGMTPIVVPYQWRSDSEVIEVNDTIRQYNKDVIKANSRIRASNKRMMQNKPDAKIKKLERHRYLVFLNIERKYHDIIRFETNTGKTLAARHPREWRRMINGISNRNTRIGVACIIWWDWFGGRNYSERWTELDHLIEEPHNASDAVVMRHLLKFGYSPYLAKKRLVKKYKY